MTSLPNTRVSLALVFVAACSSHGSPQGSPPQPPPDPCSESALLGCGPPPPGSFAPKATPLRRLTIAQYRSSLVDLLGASITVPDDLEPDTEVDGFVSLGATRTTPSAHGTDQYAAAAYAVAHQALASSPSRDAFVGCVPSAPDDMACAGAFVRSWGRRAFRRPLTEEEAARYTTVFATAAGTLADFHASLEYVVAAILQSPYFLYRVELGHADSIDPARHVLDDYEIATRLSFFLWNTTPDPELLDAAESGSLATDEGLDREVKRLLASPRAREAENRFFSELFQLDRLDNLPQLPAYYPQMTPSFGAAARDEMLGLIGDVVASRDTDYRELFETTRALPNAEIASLYGVESTSAPALLPAERAGMFARAGFLALTSHASSTSPTKRGKFVREVVLCQVVPPPPPNANVALQPDVPSPMPLTLRERLASHSINPVCASCHRSLDAIGLGLEEFDGIGALRASEAGRPIDNAGSLDGTPFTGAPDLGRIVARHGALGPCLVRNAFRYATGRLESDGETPVLGALAEDFEARGRRVHGLFGALVRSASFRYGGEPE